jgi:hypothetical protein
MAVVQVNIPGIASTQEGYISSITVRTAGAATVLTPDVNGQITVSALAATQLTAINQQQRSLITG